MKGVLLVDKPAGITSHDVVDRIRRAANMRRIGHTGTLDPAATGLLVLCLGEATRLSEHLTGLDKVYEGAMRLGIVTDSYDLDGKVLNYRGVRVAGLEGCRGAGGDGVKYTEREMSKKVLALRYRIWRAGGVDIIITHTSPRHVHDAEDSLHQGFESFHRLIRRCRPRYFIHGHMHLNYRLDARRASLLGDTLVINAYGHYLLDIDTSAGR